ncbi:MAG: hypothetical protein KGI08_00240 [Thaumarchaeota archaeon]|nr:hypothetical protein [Nitrososphaerota archaeon]
MSYTLEQLQGMGAQPLTDTSQSGYTFDQLQNMGAVPFDVSTTTPPPVFSTPKTDTVSEVSSLGGSALNYLSGIGRGVGSSIAETGLQLGQLATKGVGAVTGEIGKTRIGRFLGAQQASELSKQAADVQQKLIEDVRQQREVPGGTVGGIVGDIATIAAPSKYISGAQTVLGKATKGSALFQELTKAPVLGKVAKYGTELATHIAPEAAFGYIYGLVKSEGDFEAAKQNAITFGVASGLFKSAADAYQQLRGGLGENVMKALGMTGVKGLTNTVQRNAQAANALKLISEYARGTTVQDINGVEKEWNPLKTNFWETAQAWKTARDKVYQSYTNIAKQAGDEGAYFTQKDFNDIIENLKSSYTKDVTGKFKSKAQSLIEGIQNTFGTYNPADEQYYFKNTPLTDIQSAIEKINVDVNPLSDKAAAEVSGDTSSFFRNTMDKKIESATGEQYQSLRNQYATLKSIEKSLESRTKSIASKVGGGWGTYLEGFGTIDIITSLARGDASLRGALLTGMGKTIKELRNPENNLNRAFKLIEGKEPRALQSRIFGQ